MTECKKCGFKMNSEAYAIQEGICIRCRKIGLLENMLRKMVEGTLGCSGFNIVETEALRFAIKELTEKLEVKPT